MSAFDPKNEQTQLQSLKVQELCIRGTDHGMYSISGGSTYVLIREPVEDVYLGRVKVDSSNLNTEFQQANLSVVDSVSLTAVAPSNRGAIKFTGLAALADNDCLIVKYTVRSHL